MATGIVAEKRRDDLLTVEGVRDRVAEIREADEQDRVWHEHRLWRAVLQRIANAKTLTAEDQQKLAREALR